MSIIEKAIKDLKNARTENYKTFTIAMLALEATLNTVDVVEISYIEIMNAIQELNDYNCRIRTFKKRLSPKVTALAISALQDTWSHRGGGID